MERGVKSVEGLSPDEEAAHDRRSNLYLKNTIRKAKQIAVWIVVIAFGFLMVALLVAVFVLLWVHIGDVTADAEKVSDLLGDAAGWILVALSALLIDKRLRGEK